MACLALAGCSGGDNGDDGQEGDDPGDYVLRVRLFAGAAASYTANVDIGYFTA